MRLLVLFFLLPGRLMAQTTPDSIWISPVHSQPGQQVTVSFTTGNTTLAKAKVMQGGLYSIDKNETIRAQDLSFHKTGDTWQATASAPDTAVAIVASVSDGSGNFLKACALGLYGSDGRPLREGYHALTGAYSFMGNSLFGMKADPGKVNEYTRLYWDSAKTAPQSFDEKISFAQYKKDTALTLKVLADLPLDSGASEPDYFIGLRLASRLKNQPLSDILTNLRHQRFPDGDWKKGTYYTRFSEAPDLAQKLQILKEYQAAYPGDIGTPSSFTKLLKKRICRFLADQGNLPEAISYLPADARGDDKSGLYNEIAWGAFQHATFLPEAIALSRNSLDTLKAFETAMVATGKNLPPYYTRVQYARILERNYTNYADTYAALLYKTGDYKQALVYEKLYVDGPTPKTASIERYYQILEKVEKPAKVIAGLSGYIEKGKSDSAMDAQYVRLYKGPGSAEEALAALKAKAMSSKKAEMVKTTLNEPAGGPCKASMPAMQKIVNKHKGDSTVVLLFVDTWEHGDNKKQMAADRTRPSQMSLAGTSWVVYL
jgi:hypothetical protein